MADDTPQRSEDRPAPPNDHDGDLDALNADSARMYRTGDGLDYMGTYMSLDRLARALTDLGSSIARRLRAR